MPATKRPLAERVKQAVSQPKPKIESEVLPDIQTVIEDPKDQLEIIRSVEEDLAYIQEEKLIREARKPITLKIKRILAPYKDSRFMAAGARVVHFYQLRRSLDEKALRMFLLGAKVPPVVINQAVEAATKVTGSWTLKVTPQGESEDE